MRQLLTLLAVTAVSMPCAFAANPVIDVDHGLAYPGGAEVDLNNDGYLDLVYGGIPRDEANGRIVYDADGNPVQTKYEAYKMVWNPSTKSYDVSQFQEILGERVYTAFADFNGDGIMDYFAASSVNALDSAVPSGLFLGKGDGTFTKQEITVTDENGDDFPFRPTAVDVADFNNDGKMDIVGIGWWSDPNGKYEFDGNKVSVANAVLINQGDFKFKAIATDLISYGYALDVVRVADLNNDGYPDFITAGNADGGTGPMKNGTQLGRALEVYLNLGQEAIDDGEVAFYATEVAGVSDIYHIGNANILVADFNNDGNMDIFTSGEAPGEAGHASDDYSYVHQMLINDGAGAFSPLTQQLSPDLRPLNSTHVGTRAIDYNGDGNVDLFVPGWCPTMLDGTDATQAGYWFTNSGTGLLSAFTRVPGGSEIGVFFTEDGVRGARNYFMSGQSWDATYFTADQQGRVAVSLKNDNAKAARPEAPTALSASVDNAKVTLSWTPAAGSNKNATYEYYIKDKATGKFYTSCSSHVGGELDGVRKLLTPGNAYLNTTITLNEMRNGTYEWGVQTINASYEGSTFATGEFAIVNGGVADFKAVDVAIKVVGDGIEVAAEEAGNVYVYDLSGVAVCDRSFDRSATVSLPSGYYIVKVVTDNGTKVQKVIL